MAIRRPEQVACHRARLVAQGCQRVSAVATTNYVVPERPRVPSPCQEFSGRGSTGMREWKQCMARLWRPPARFEPGTCLAFARVCSLSPCHEQEVHDAPSVRYAARGE